MVKEREKNEQDTAKQTPSQARITQLEA